MTWLHGRPISDKSLQAQFGAPFLLQYSLVPSPASGAEPTPYDSLLLFRHRPNLPNLQHPVCGPDVLQALIGVQDPLDGTAELRLQAAPGYNTSLRLKVLVSSCQPTVDGIFLLPWNAVANCLHDRGLLPNGYLSLEAVIHADCR